MMIRDYKHLIGLEHIHLEYLVLFFKMISFDDYINENKTEHNKNVSHIFQIIPTEFNIRRLRFWKNKLNLINIIFDRKSTRH